MTAAGKEETCNCKTGQSLITVPQLHHQSTSLSAYLGLNGGNRAHSVAVSMLPTPTRVIVKTLLKTLLHILIKLWRWASSFLVLIFLAAWFYGGFLPYCLFFMAVLNCASIFSTIPSIMTTRQSKTLVNDFCDNANESCKSSQTDTTNVQKATMAETRSVNPPQNDPFPEVENERQISCCLSLTSPSILLRNLVLPTQMWKFFPEGLGYNASDYLLYQPDFPPESRIFVASPDQFGMPYEEVWLVTKDRVKIHAYLIKQMVSNSRNLPVIIFFHGNAGNIGSRLENAQLLFKEIKCHIMLVEYRGYGRSEGIASESGLYLDAQASFEYIDAREDFDSKKIFLFGRSLGGAVAIDLASRCDFRDRVAGLIVENSFTSVPAIAKHLFPIRPVRWLPRFCYKNKFESYTKVSSVVCPTLFICGTEDEMIPEPMMTELFNKCSAPIKRLIRFAGGHNDTWMCDKSYPLRISEFIAEALDADRRPSFQTYSDNIV